MSLWGSSRRSKFDRRLTARAPDVLAQERMTRSIQKAE